MSDTIFKALAAPIPADETKSKTLSNRRITFINARVVMNRLDKVVGPANWYDVYQEVSEGVLCTLYVRIDGEWVGKSDVGDKDGANYSPFKGMYSDAFKRAAVRWGIGRELYGDGTAYDDDPTPERPQTRKTTPPARDSAPKRSRTPSAPSAAYDDGKGNSPDPRDDGHRDDFPTIREYWPQVSSGLLNMKIGELPDGVNVGAIIGTQAQALGYADYDDVKRVLELKSHTDFVGTLDALLNRVLQLAPKINT